ncbi:MAG: alpha/beta hydrolase [Candidatus Omnitrophica bacterium]|nr:alpha/beta hydrolase [Candidatus Omnitrophota bacterium]
MPNFIHDQIDFFFQSGGDGLPFFFQHGLGADSSQTFGLYHPTAGVRLIGLDCRAHGQTRPVGNPEKISLAASADDLRALMDYLEIERAVVGGISMGAAIALNFAVRFPDRRLGLVLSRPAWLAGPRDFNVNMFGLVAKLIRKHGAREAAERFQQSPQFADLQRQFPDTANSLLGQFQHPRAEETVVRLERIPHSSPCHSLEELKKIDCPTLILAHRDDPVHPFEYGETLSAAIPGSRLREITPKSVSVEQHGRDVQRCLDEFLQQHFLPA